MASVPLLTLCGCGSTAHHRLQHHHQHNQLHRQPAGRPQHLLHRLREETHTHTEFGMSPEILSNFCCCIVESILTGCITVWYGSCFGLQRVVKTAEMISWTPLPSLQSIYHHRVHRRATSILKDPNQAFILRPEVQKCLVQDHQTKGLFLSHCHQTPKQQIITVPSPQLHSQMHCFIIIIIMLIVAFFSYLSHVPCKSALLCIFRLRILLFTLLAFFRQQSQNFIVQRNM